jgi:DNA-binding NtrC family response regulator
VETPRPERVRTCIESAAARRKAAPDTAAIGVWRNAIIGSSPEMQRVFEIVQLVAARRASVLITGETGTGKEVIARAIHIAGGRGHLPLVAVNCGAIPENLVESELFGYAKGAFTGAVQSRAGKFEQADGGTIFLDEVGELPLEAQAKLLRVLQEREVQRIGSAETVRLNVRVIAATNANLAEAVRRKEFREDLYYRLNVIPLHLPPLRDRIADIPDLVRHFLAKVCESENLPQRSVTPEVLARLALLRWPGNVRQLEHAIEMAVILSGSRTALSERDFPLFSETCAWQTAFAPDPPADLPPDGMDLDDAVRRFERSMVQQALLRCRGNKARAAQMLRMKRTMLLDRLKSLDAYNGPEMQEICA